MAPNPNLERLHEGGRLDLARHPLPAAPSERGVRELIRELSVTGATSNPTIFAKAITGSDLYDDELRGLADRGQRDLQELFFSLALDDVRAAAGELCADIRPER